MAKYLTIALVALGLGAGSAIAADEPAAETPKSETAELNEQEQAFVKLMTNAVLAGTFTIERDGKGSDAQRHDERYAIKGISKVAEDRWLVHSQIKYGQLDVTVPVPVQVHWANDTPVLSVTDLTIPLVGSEFTARLLFYDGRYAGTWRHGKVGGLMFGTIEHPNAAQEEPAEAVGEMK
ncbi:MAG: hypothetical protein KF774_02655 [Planctomyces sp.]|nr:hypothetical protein [Planctomyces sp.]